MEPRTSRPHMPGYGVVGADQGRGLLDWSWARKRLERSHDYWVTTVTPDHRPHVMPVWGVLLGDRFLWSTSPGSRKARNLRANPAIAVATADPSQPVVMEGFATLVTDPDEMHTFAAAMDRKYATDHGAEFYAANATFSVRPQQVVALDTEDFTGSPTRWSFPSGA